MRTRAESAVRKCNTPVRIRITRTPNPADLADYDVRRLRPGEILDVTPRLATLLIVAGNAEPVLTTTPRAAADRRDPKKRRP
jgi:hypothetical protein